MIRRYWSLVIGQVDNLENSAISLSSEDLGFWISVIGHWSLSKKIKTKP